MSKTESIGDRVEKNFSAPSFRENQKEAVMKLLYGLEELDKDVMLLDAPTGAGKSLILDGVAKCINEKADTTPMPNPDSDIPAPINAGTFITTPLNSLVDQLDDDEFIKDHIITLKGRNNYNCIHPEDSGTPVNEAICQRQESFECDVKGSCPYYGRKYRALQHPEVVTNLSYLMAEGMIPGAVQGTFGNRDLLIVDECQKLEDFAMNYISFTVSSRTVPDDVWGQVEIPDDDHEDDMEYLVSWLKDEVMQAVRDAIEYRESQAMMSKDESQELENLKQFKMRVENFLEDVANNDWIAQIEWEVNKNRPNTRKIQFRPIELGRFLQNLLWSRADKIILSSATIPKGGWVEEIGLGNKDVGKVSLDSTFPIENRPIVLNQHVGKMTKNEREDNAWPMAQKIQKIADFHEGKGMVHCRSYGIMKMLANSWKNHGEREWFNENVMLQDRYNREESLEQWQSSDKQVFLSVAMDEGVSLDGDACRWQVLAKTLYKSMGDKRVRFRVMERNEWDWYNRHAAIQIAQAYGRAVRGPEDWATFYILDTSAVNLIKQNKKLFPEWFLEAVQEDI